MKNLNKKKYSYRCKFCGKEEEERIIFPITLNNEKIFCCENCFSKQENINQIGFKFPFKANHDKQDIITIYVSFSKPEYFGNAKYASITYASEKNTDVKLLETKAKIDFVSQALGLSSSEIVHILNDEENIELQKCKEIYGSITIVSEQEYKNYKNT